MTNKKPKKHFRGQKDDERVISIFHKHWISFVKPIAIFLPFFVVSIAILFYQGQLGTGFLIVGFIIFVGAVSYLLYNYLIWNWDVYILTDQRVIDIDQKSLFHKVVSEANLNNIQDTTFETKGVWQTMFNYGKVNILTASSGANIEFENVDKPEHVMSVIAEAKDNYVERMVEGEAGSQDFEVDDEE